MFQKFAERDSKVGHSLFSKGWGDRCDSRNIFNPLTTSLQTERSREGEVWHQAEWRGSNGAWQQREGRCQRSQGLKGPLGALWWICSSDFCNFSCFVFKVGNVWQVEHVGESAGFWVCFLFLGFSLWLLTQVWGLPPADGTKALFLDHLHVFHPLNSFPPQLWTVHEYSVFHGRKRRQVHHFKSYQWRASPSSLLCPVLLPPPAQIKAPIQHFFNFWSSDSFASECLCLKVGM